MECALVITSDAENAAVYDRALREVGGIAVTVAASGGEARGILADNGFDLCLLDAPLPDETGDKLAEFIADGTESQIIMLRGDDVRGDDVRGAVADGLERRGVLLLSKPCGREALIRALRFAAAAHTRMRRVRNENERLLQKIEDIKIIDRAKCILISNFQYDEAAAHKHMEKQAMDLRIGKRAVAERILKVYEN